LHQWCEYRIDAAPLLQLLGQLAFKCPGMGVQEEGVVSAESRCESILVIGNVERWVGDSCGFSTSEKKLRSQMSYHSAHASNDLVAEQGAVVVHQQVAQDRRSHAQGCLGMREFFAEARVRICPVWVGRRGLVHPAAISEQG